MKVAVVDIETTGLDALNELILEIGIVELNIETGETKVLFNNFVKETSFGEEYRNAWIFDNSDMKFEDGLNAPNLEKFRNELQEIFNNYDVTAFNKTFDLGFLKARGFHFPKELPCIMITATDICKIPFTKGIRKERYGNREFKWPKVQEAWDFFFPNSNYTEGHRAADDAIHEAKILFELYKSGKFPL